MIDNLSNSDKLAFDCVINLTGYADSAAFIEGDIRDAQLFNQIFNDYRISAMMHFAKLKAVGESMAELMKYYDNNIHGTIPLLKAMQIAEVHNFICYGLR